MLRTFYFTMISFNVPLDLTCLTHHLPVLGLPLLLQLPHLGLDGLGLAVLHPALSLPGVVTGDPAHLVQEPLARDG